MKVLLTGGTGFIGSRVARRLLDRGHDVHAIVRPTSALGAVVQGEGTFTAWRADLRDTAAVRSAVFGAKPDAALHLAWYTQPGRYLHDEPKNLESLSYGIALLGHLAEAGCPRIVVGGTCLEGASGSADTFYAVAKRTMHDVAANLGSGEPSTACAHIFSVYGPGEDERRAVPSVVRSLLRGDPVAVSAGTELRDYVHVDDVAEALTAVLESNAVGTVDVCSGQLRSLRALFEEIGAATGRSDLIRWGERVVAQGEAFEVLGDPRALADLGWTPSRSLGDGIAETVAWWREHLALSVTASEAR